MTTEKVKRKLTAILSADVKGYSRLMGADEVGTIRILQTYRGVISDLIQKTGGRVVDSPGDNILAEFASVVDALESAVEIQRELKGRNADRSESRRMEFRIGINLGDVVEEGERIYGDGVNIAARIEGLAEGGGICISGTAFDQIGKRLPLGYEYMGEQAVKNIEKPVRVYRVLTEPESAGKVIGEKEPKQTKLGWKAAAAVAVFVLVAGGIVWNFYWRESKIEPASKEKMAFPLPDQPSIAVLPFVNMSGDPKDEYFSDGLTEQIITSLSMVPRLFVIARNSTFVYKGKPVKVQKVAEDLGVRYVMEGSVQRSGEKVRITAQLIDALTGRHIWSEHYDREAKDLFALEDEITIKLMEAMKVELVEGEQARHWATKGHTDNLKAFEKFQQAGSLLYRNTKQDNDTARHLFEEAIVLDPNYVRAYVRLGYTHYFDAVRGWSESPPKSLQKALELAQKALSMEDSIDIGHSLLAMIYTVMRQYDKGVSEAERAVVLDPGGLEANSILAWIIGVSGNWEESILYAKQSMRLNPIPDLMPYYVLGRAYFMTGQYDESIATWKKTLQINPHYLVAHTYLAACYSSMGRDAEATAESKEVLRINPKFSVESYAKTLFCKNEADVEREVAALKKAGLK
jgi:adenylate cyclase